MKYINPELTIIKFEAIELITTISTPDITTDGIEDGGDAASE